MGCELDDAAEAALGEEVAEGDEVDVPAAVLENGEMPALGFGQGDELVALCARGAEGLLDDDYRWLGWTLRTGGWGHSPCLPAVRAAETNSK